MGNLFHLVVETPRANLVSGMKWFLGTYTAIQSTAQVLWASVQWPLPEGGTDGIEMLEQAGWSEAELQERSKGDKKKARMAARLRKETTMSWQWIAKRLEMGHWRTASNAVRARTK
jgi:hypothetical protein